MADHRRVKQLFLAARGVAAGEREAWLAEACANDVVLLREVESLLAAEEGIPCDYLESRFGPSLTPGSTVSHYRIVGLLGTGGMGEVYRAHDERLGRDVAIKVLPALATADESARARLLQEARAVAALNHPHVCTIHEVSEADGRIYIAMELLDGPTLSEAIPRGGLPIEQVMRYGTQIADALAHAHKRGIVHRDLKPGNVIIIPDSRAKVLDFGLAKRQTGEQLQEATTPSRSSLSARSALAGTPLYMAPEQLRGQMIDKRSDVWALGVVLYEMVAGETPFQGQTDLDLSAAVLGEPPRPLPAKVPVELRAVVERCLQKEPEQRYACAADVLAALESIVSETGQRVRLGLGNWSSRGASRFLQLGIGVSLTTIALLVGFNIWGLRDKFFGPETAKIESIAVLPFTSISPGTGDQLLELGLADTLIARLSRSNTLRVRSLASARRFADPDRDPIEAGRQLDATYVIEGSTQRHGDRVRVNARLLAVHDGTTVWADTFEETADRVFTLQDSIAGAVTGELAHENETTPVDTRSPCEGADAEAYRAFLTGRYLIGRLTTERLRHALVAYRRAIDLDPSCARAYAGMAWTYRAQVVVSDRDPREYFPLARAAAEQAIAIDPQSVEGYAQRGFVELWHDWNWSAADASFQHALALSPSSVEAHLGYAHLLVFLGQLDASVGHAQQVRELDPLSPLMRSLSAGIVGAAYRNEEARRGIERTLELDADFWHALFIRGGMALDRGDPGSAIADLERAANGSGGSSLVLAVLAMAHATAGDRAAARAILDRLQARTHVEYVPATSLAAAHLGLGETEAALDLLERAYRERDVRLAWLSVDARWNALREEPRFRALAERMGLSAEHAYGRF